MRIMTNYLQILTAALAFNLQFPNYLSGILTSAQKAGESSGVFLSFDCLLMDAKIVEMFDNVAFLKVLCLAMIPILLIIVSVFLFRFWFCRDSMKFKRYSWITIITIFFLLHPTLTQFCLRIFKCVEIGNGQRQVEMDIVTECWSDTHVKWIILLGKHSHMTQIYIAIPMLVIYVIGTPVLAFMILFLNRKNLSENHVLRYFLLLYQGLKHDRYYWELCNTARKCLLLSLHVFIPDDIKIVKGMFGVFTLFFFSTLQLRLQPFKIPVITQVGKYELQLTQSFRGPRNDLKLADIIWRNHFCARRSTSGFKHIFLRTHSDSKCKILDTLDILCSYSV